MSLDRYFAYDSSQNFYYCGSEPPFPHMYQHYLVDNSPAIIAYDTETISTKEKIVVGVAIAPTPDVSFYFPLFPEVSPVTPWWLLKDPKVEKIIHNCLFDLVALREYNLDSTNIKDTTDLARLLGHPSAVLGDLSFELFNQPLTTAKDLMGTGKTMLDADKDATARMCCTHAMTTYRIWNELSPKVDMDYYMKEMELIPIMIEMSYRGIKLDQTMRGLIEEKLIKDVDYYRQLCEGEGFNPASPQQVAYILANRGAYGVFSRLPFTKDKYGRRTAHLSTAEETLRKMDDPMASLVLVFRERSKLLGTYILPWRNEPRAYTRYHLDAVTGRPSSTDRNMQNIPTKEKVKDMGLPFEPRNCLLPDSGCWTDMDFSQLELRILAHLSGDREMQYIFSLPTLLPDGSKNEEADIHQQSANFMGIPRKTCKNVNFAMIYGATDQTIMETANIRNLELAHNLKVSWGKKFPQAFDWIMTMQEEALMYPWAETLLGRRIRLPSLEEDSPEGIQRKGVNYRIQGSAAEGLKRTLKALWDRGLDIALQVHDELVIDGRVEKELLQSVAEDILPLHTPIEVRYLQQWE